MTMNPITLGILIALFAAVCYVFGRNTRRPAPTRGFVLDMSSASSVSAVVRLAGKDITHLVKGVTVEARGGDLARVTLDMNPRGLAVRLDGAVVDAIDHPMWIEKSGAPGDLGPLRGRGAAAQP